MRALRKNLAQNGPGGRFVMRWVWRNEISAGSKIYPGLLPPVAADPNVAVSVPVVNPMAADPYGPDSPADYPVAADPDPGAPVPGPVARRPGVTRSRSNWNGLDHPPESNQLSSAGGVPFFCLRRSRFSLPKVQY